MYDLIFLATMTLVSPNHKTLASCQNAIREIYIQKTDPMGMLPKDVVRDVVNQRMKYDAPVEYKCVKKA